ncbi:hypothetical protein [Natrinema limicola]|uniref:Calcium-binding outer membrane-like protein n=1 Tax=Natrinema limicola JCM 13563 TaxID=1230457 RepID=M0CS93_9EURY|nr:hypothetical protein [Natrinema limicola]ELZ24754.1 calcium-binding outer membrane-like protein [Natrinema limicola JCM 13563]
MNDNDTEQVDNSRHPLVKKGALATTALAIGAGATSGTAAAQDDENDTVVVFGDHYRPGVDFDVISELNPQTRDELIDDSGAADDVFDEPDDWDAYIINYDIGEEAPSWGILLTEEVDLDVGDSETMGENGQFRDAALDLVEATL